MSPVLQNPLLLGADVVMHSLTKYIGGHSDVLGGAIILNDLDLYDKLFVNMRTMGTILSPFSSWLVLRGSKTLNIRVRKATENAMNLA